MIQPLQRRHLTYLSLLLLAAAPMACDSSPPKLEEVERNRLKAEIKAEVLSELRDEMKLQRRSAAAVRPRRPQLSDAERAAIADARARRDPAPSRPSSASAAAPDLPTPGAASPHPGLTADDVAAALDDPAASQGGIRDRLKPDDGEADPGAPPLDHADGGKTLREGTIIYAHDGALRLTDLAVATTIDKHKPVGVQRVYDRMPEMFFCFTTFNNGLGDTTVTHVWRRGTRLVSRVELEVGKSRRWRTWSRQRTNPRWTGPWSCEVLGDDGARIGLVEFEVRAAAPAAP